MADKDLKQLESKLKQEVDPDFFLDPHQFRTLPRVIDILGAQLLESDANNANISNNDPSNNNTNNNNTNNNNTDAVVVPSITDYKSHFDQLHKNNPAYTSLRKQQNVVEEGIEHLSLVHYRDLNASVVAVGQVSNRFGEAVGQVKGLRAQVLEIREHLANANGSGGTVNVNVNVNGVSGNGTETGNGNGTGAVGGQMAIIPEDEDEEQQQRGDQEDGSKKGTNSRSMVVSSQTNTRTQTHTQTHTHPIGGKSLRELWLKKLESEAVLSLLQKLQIIRETPVAFDLLVHSQPCRIGAAVVLLSDAINTMFKDDVAQIQALNKITEQLMTRKQKAEEIVWETLQDVLFLRTGDYPREERKALEGVENGVGFNPTSIHVELNGNGNGNGNGGGSIHTKESNMNGAGAASKRRARSNFQQASGQRPPRKHLYVSALNQRRNDDDSDADASEDDSMTMYSDDYSSKSGHNSIEKRNGNVNGNGNIANQSSTGRLAKPNLRKSKTAGSYFVASAHAHAEDPSPNIFANFHNHQGQLLPRAMMESELDLEAGADELRCLETFGSGTTAYSSFSNDGTLVLPRYNDPILGLRILIEALAKLGRLDDVERCISENIDRELRKIAEMEQAKTLAKLEQHRNRSKAGAGLGGHGHGHGHRRNATMGGMDAADEKLKDFKVHMKSLLTSFGSVMLRLSHLAQILRHRIVSNLVRSVSD
jgi:hypothetical protein